MVNNPLIISFPVVGDKLIKSIVRFYIPIIGIPVIKGGITIPYMDPMGKRVSTLFLGPRNSLPQKNGRIFSLPRYPMIHTQHRKGPTEGCVSCSADRTLRFYDFEFTKAGEMGRWDSFGLNKKFNTETAGKKKCRQTI